MKRVAIKVENNIKEILTFLEEKNYKWVTGGNPTDGINWGSKCIIIDNKTLFHRTCEVEPNSISFERFKKDLTSMKTNKILPGYKLVLENGNTFVVMEYKNTKIVFPEGSSRSVTNLEDLCNEDLSPKQGVSRIIKVLNSLNISIWERKFTRSEIYAGYKLINKQGVEFLVVASNCELKLLGTKHFVVGPKLKEVINTDMTPTSENCSEIVEVRDQEGKVVYSKK